MTLSTETNKIVYDGVEFQDTFAYNFRVDQVEDMEVYLAAELIPAGNYVVTGIGDDLGGDVILDSPLTEAQTVTLLRDVPQTQQTDYQPFDAFPAESHESALDKLTMLTQQLQEQVNRSLLVPVDDDSGEPFTLGTPVALEVVQYNADETGIEASGIDATEFNNNVQAAADSADAAAASAAQAENTFDLKKDGYELDGLHKIYAADLDDLAVNSKFFIDSTAVTNEPPDFVGLGVIETDYWGTDQTQAVQLLTSMDNANAGKAWIRNQEADVWSDWNGFGSGGATVSDTPPPDPNDGALWWDSIGGKPYIFYNDGDSSQWVEEVPNAVDSVNALGVDYDNTDSELDAVNVQEAIDELAVAPVIIAMGESNSAGTTLRFSFGFSGVSSLGTGRYRYTFTTPQPDTQYVVSGLAAGSSLYVSWTTLTTTHFDIQTNVSSGAATSVLHSVLVTRIKS